MNIDMSQYLDVFLEESREHLDNLNQKLLILEKNPGDLMSLNEIFRAAHTVKGMSSTMGFESLADLTHHMENVLSDLKEGMITADGRVIDVLFRCFDRLQLMVDNIQNGESPNMDNSDLISLLETIKTGGMIEIPAQSRTKAVPDMAEIAVDANLIEFNSYDITVLKEAIGKNLIPYRVQVKIDPGCLMKSVRAFMIFKNLEEDGEILKANPPTEDLDEGKFDDEFNIILVTGNDEETIRQRIDSISEVKAGIITMIAVKDLVEKSRQEPAVPKPVVPDAAIPAASAGEKQVRMAETDKATVDEALRTHKVKQTVRVDIEKLDNLMNLVGELVINKGRLEQIGSTKKLNELNETIEQIERITNDLQNVVMKVRMVPIEQVFNRFPRMVRDLAKDLGKEIDFEIEGKETELDRTVIDEIGDPLVHLLRNAVDHGLEQPEERIGAGKPAWGRVKLGARHEGNNVFIEVEDDGCGLDLEAIARKAVARGLITAAEAANLSEKDIIDFLFEAGFSTSEAVTDISGRGVGLDVVKNKIESLNGEIFVESKKGEGTRFKIRLPLTLAIIQALLVKVADETYAVPLTSVDETTMIEHNEIKTIQGQEVVLLRGSVLPLARASHLLEVPKGSEAVDDMMYVVVVRKAGRQVGLIVDSLIGQQEIVIKSLGKLMAGIPGIAGATILGDGDVSLILDVSTLI